MDADLSHDPRFVPALIEAIENGADVAIGSRYVAGGNVVGWTQFLRTLARLRFARAAPTGRRPARTP